MSHDLTPRNVAKCPQVCQVQRQFSRWSGPGPRWLSKEMSTLHPVLHEKDKIQTSIHMSFIAFPHPREMRCWNKWMKYASCLHKATLIIYPFCWPSSRNFAQAKRTLLRTLPLTPKPFTSQSIPQCLSECFCREGPQEPLWKAWRRPSGKYSGPMLLLPPKALSLFQPMQSLPSSAILLYLLAYFQQIVVGRLLSSQTLASSTVRNKTNGVTSHSVQWGEARNN